MVSRDAITVSVARDVARGYITAGDAGADYGVVLSAADPRAPFRAADRLRAGRSVRAGGGS